MHPIVGAYYAIHYGTDYLEHSIRSVYPVVDMIGIFYAPLPSHGYRRTPLANPDSWEDLEEAIWRAGDPQRKIRIEHGGWKTEAEHRNHAVKMMLGSGANIVLIVDSDEVWDEGALEEAICKFQALGANLARVNFLHFWRSFDWVCRCEMMPIRLQNAPVGTEGYIRMSQPVYHFGYASRPAMVRYKASIHGHRAEWRNGWFEEKFMAWSPYPPDGFRVGDVHPTAGGIWYPRRFDKEQLPIIMRSHRYWNKEIIE